MLASIARIAVRNLACRGCLLPGVAAFSTKRTSTNSPTISTALEPSEKYEPITIPEREGGFSVEDYDYADSGVITPQMQAETDDMINDLMREVMLPPDVYTTEENPRPYLQTLPHDPEEFFETRDKTASNYLTLIRVHQAKSLVPQGFAVYEEAVRGGILTPDEISYGAMITLCGSAARAEANKSVSYAPSRFRDESHKALQLFDEMKDAGIVPSLPVYGALISALCKLEHVDQGFRVMELMKYADLTPDKFCYTSLIMGCSRAGQIDRAMDTFMQMRINGVEPDVFTYNTMIRMSAETENAEGALSYLGELEYFGHIPDVITFTNAIYACGKREDFHEKAFELYDTCMARGYKPTVELLNVLMFVTQKMGDFETCKMLLDQFKQFKLAPDEVSYTTYLQAIAQKNRQDFYICHDGSRMPRPKRIELAEEVFDSLLQQGLKPSRRALNALLSVYTKGLRVTRAEDFRKIVFSRHGHQFDYYTYFLMINMYYHKKQLDKALELFEEMKAADVSPDWDVYNLLLRLAYNKKSMFIGVKILKEMCDNDLVADHEIAYPFQAMVEALPGYKAPTSLETPFAMAANPGIQTISAREKKQAAAQRAKMMETPPEDMTPLEFHRTHVANQGNDQRFNPSDPNFEHNYINREKFKDNQVAKPTKWKRKKYKEGMLSESDPHDKEVGAEILAAHTTILKDQWLLEGKDKDKPRETKLDKIKVGGDRGPASELDSHGHAYLKN